MLLPKVLARDGGNGGGGAAVRLRSLQAAWPNETGAGEAVPRSSLAQRSTGAPNGK